MMNKVILIGNLGRDPEVRSMQNGSRVVSFSIATTEAWTDKGSGERKERTHWHKIVIFNDRIGDVAEKYLRTGSKVCVEGALEYRKFQDQSGHERETAEVVLRQFRGELVLLGGKEDAGRPPSSARQPVDHGSEIPF